MANHPTRTPIENRFMAVVMSLVLLVAFTAALISMYTPEITSAEALSLWMVDDTRAVNLTTLIETPSEAVRAIIDNVRETVNRLRETGHMPLYPLLLEGWSIFFGESLFTLRIPSAWFVLVGVTALAALFTRMKNTLLMVVIMVFIVAVPLSAYVGSSAEPAALMFCFSALTIYHFTRWRDSPTLKNAIFYGLALSLALMTHITAVFLIAACGLVQLWGISRRVQGSFSLGTLYSAMHDLRLTPWLVITAIATFPAMVWSYIARGEIGVVSMSALWILVLILIAWGGVWLVQLLSAHNQLRTQVAIIIVCVTLILSISPLMMPPRPQYTPILEVVMQARNPAETALISYAPQSIAAYQDQRHGFSAGMAVNVGWRDHNFESLSHIVKQATQNNVPVWVMMPAADEQTNQVIEAIMLEGYSASVCLRVDARLFYRFTRSASDC